jgi:hypothetical protein
MAVLDRATQSISRVAELVGRNQEALSAWAGARMRRSTSCTARSGDAARHAGRRANRRPHRRHPSRAPRVVGVALLVLAATLPGAAAERPAPPAGFAWVELTDMRAAFLLPDGWHFRQRGGRDDRTFVYYLTAEPMGPERRPATGLTVAAMRRISESSGVPAAPYAEALGWAVSEDEELLDSWSATAGSLPLFGARIRRAREAEAPVVVHRLTIGNGATDTLYVLTFESPEAAWPETKKLGEILLTRFALDEAF